MVRRWRQESGSLQAIQRHAWQGKLHELGLDGASTTSNTSEPAGTVVTVAVPAVSVSDPTITHKFFGRSTALMHP